MSSRPLDQFPLQLAAPHIWEGFIATNPNDISTKVFVTIPDYDPELRFGPCRWQSRDASTLPERGDPCLVIMDNNRNIWVVAWWPFNE